MKKVPALFTAAAFSLVSIGTCWLLFTPYFGKKMLLGFGFLCILLILGLLWYPKLKRFSCVLLVSAALIAGAFVNPVQQGSARLTETSLYHAIETIREEEPDALFAYEGERYPITNYLLYTGVRSFNATQVYPRFEVFEKLDPDGTYREIYNRYAHIELSVGQDSETSFELLNPDYFKLHLSPEALYETAGVRYVLSRNDLTALSGERVIFEPVFSENGFTIYRLKK